MGIEDLKGITLLNIELEREPDQLMFYSECGRRWRMWHCQDCCENVIIEEIIGDLSDLDECLLNLISLEKLTPSEGTTTKSYSRRCTRPHKAPNSSHRFWKPAATEGDAKLV